MASDITTEFFNKTDWNYLYWNKIHYYSKISETEFLITATQIFYSDIFNNINSIFNSDIFFDACWNEFLSVSSLFFFCFCFFLRASVVYKKLGVPE